MTTFKFKFSEVSDTNDAEPNNSKEDNQWFESSEIIPDISSMQNIDNSINHAKMFVCGDVEIGHVIANETISNIGEGQIKNLLDENKHNDLVAAKYEGGFKIWECTSDLITYFEENKQNINFENKKVLDLGCGAGILGIYAFTNKAYVTFQDYNKEVIEHATIPNILLNIEDSEKEAEFERCKFYCGDWASFCSICNESYDIIITSETIYNESNYDKLLSIFIDKLNNNGTVYVAAKTHYFGVGGGTRQFEEVIRNNGSFKIEVCWKSSGGVQREILRITKIVTTNFI